MNWVGLTLFSSLERVWAAENIYTLDVTKRLWKKANYGICICTKEKVLLVTSKKKHCDLF